MRWVTIRAMFRVVILGSGASLPTLQRHPAAVAVQYEGDVHLLDCGEGTQLQWRRTPLRFGRLRSIAISHLHGDHVNGLVGLLQVWISRDLIVRLLGREGGVKGLLLAAFCGKLGARH